MTQKDYQKFAAVVKARVALIEALPKGTMLARAKRQGAWTIVHAFAGDIADVLADDNPRFDRERFFAACGITK